MEPIVRHTVATPWLSLLVLGCIILLAVAKYVYPFRFQEFIQLPITNKYFLVQGKDDTLWDTFNSLLFIVQLISFSILAFLFFKVFYPQEVTSNKWLFVQIMTGIGLLIGVKVFIEKIIATVFKIEPIINTYLYQKLTYRNIISLFCLLCCVLFLYTIPLTKNAITATIVLIASFNAISLFYSYKTFRKLILPHFFHFILYLCTLEISPYIIIYQTIVK